MYKRQSLFRILTTLLLADGGSASVCGLDVVKDYKAIRRRVGYMPCLLYTSQKLYVETVRRIKRISREIARALNISGPFNIQYLARENDIKVIECNLCLLYTSRCV